MVSNGTIKVAMMTVSTMAWPFQRRLASANAANELRNSPKATVMVVTRMELKIEMRELRRICAARLKLLEIVVEASCFGPMIVTLANIGAV